VAADAPRSAEAAAVVAALGMIRHPEGGWYAETFRDGAGVGGRSRSTAIYFLLEAGEVSAWHRVVDAAEAWHFHAGAALELGIARGATVTVQRLGPAVLAGERPQAVVPAGAWQAARSTGAWTLVGCTVAPGFEFASFEMAQSGWTPDGGTFP
jgi:uncharacterized protein